MNRQAELFAAAAMMVRSARGDGVMFSDFTNTMRVHPKDGSLAQYILDVQYAQRECCRDWPIPEGAKERRDAALAALEAAVEQEAERLFGAPK